MGTIKGSRGGRVADSYSGTPPASLFARALYGAGHGEERISASDIYAETVVDTGRAGSYNGVVFSDGHIGAKTSAFRIISVFNGRDNFLEPGVAVVLFVSGLGGVVVPRNGGLNRGFHAGAGPGGLLFHQVGHVRLEYPSLIILGGTIYFFLHTYDSIPAAAMLYYHMFFLFTTALATGSLFVAATNRYYYGRAHANRGLGYAMEISGSAAGAILTTTVLLPTIGLGWILISLLLLVFLALVGAYLTR